MGDQARVVVAPRGDGAGERAPGGVVGRAEEGAGTEVAGRVREQAHRPLGVARGGVAGGEVERAARMRHPPRPARPGRRVVRVGGGEQGRHPIRPQPRPVELGVVEAAEHHGPQQRVHPQAGAVAEHHGEAQQLGDRVLEEQFVAHDGGQRPVEGRSRAGEQLQRDVQSGPEGGAQLQQVGPRRGGSAARSRSSDMSQVAATPTAWSPGCGAGQEREPPATEQARVLRQGHAGLLDERGGLDQRERQAAHLLEQLRGRRWVVVARHPRWRTRTTTSSRTPTATVHPMRPQPRCRLVSEHGAVAGRWPQRCDRLGVRAVVVDQRPAGPPAQLLPEPGQHDGLVGVLGHAESAGELAERLDGGDRRLRRGSTTRSARGRRRGGRPRGPAVTSRRHRARRARRPRARRPAGPPPSSIAASSATPSTSVVTRDGSSTTRTGGG